MELQHGQLDGIADALKALARKDNKLPSLVAVRVYRAKQKVAEAFGPMQEARIRILREHGAKEVDGSWSLGRTAETYPACIAALTELLADRVTVELQPIALSAISGDAIGIGADDIGALLDAGIVVDDVTPAAAGEKPLRLATA